MPEIIIIRGPLGVGKTTTAKRLTEDLLADYFSVSKILVNNDLSVTHGVVPLSNCLKVNELIIPLIEDNLKKGLTSIIEGNFYYQEVIDDLNKKLSQKPKIFTLSAPLSVCVSRDAARSYSYGQMSTREVYDLVSKVEAGIEIKANEKNIDEIMEEIKQHLDL